MMLCSAIKRKRKGFSRLATFCSGTVWASVYPWEVMSDCLSITCFVFSFSLLLLHLLKFFISTYNFSYFYSPFLFPHPTEAGWVVLSCLRLTNSSGIFKIIWAIINRFCGQCNLCQEHNMIHMKGVLSY